MGGPRISRSRDLVALVKRMAAHAAGVASAELVAVTGLHADDGLLCTQLTRMVRQGEVHRAKAPGFRLRYFGTAEAAQRFLADPLAASQEAGESLAVLQAFWQLLRAAAEAAEQSPAVAAGLRQAKPLRVAGSSRRAVPVPSTPVAHVQAITTPATKVTVYQRRTDPTRVDLMADPLPTVPGWGSGPVIRAGALDYRRHQIHRSE